MRKKILVRGPCLTRSGYGEHARFVLRSLRTRQDIFDIYVIPVGWGQTGWTAEDNEERKWLDEKIKATAVYMQQGGQFDVSLQVTIPNEWEPLAPVNIGVTAGIETTRVTPVWLEKSNMMDKVVTISEHSKWGFTNTVYEGTNSQTGEPMTLSCSTPVEVVHYPVKAYETLPELELNLDFDFNFLAVAQQGPRKNLENTIKWFVEENIDQKVGLVVKTFIKNGALIDRRHTEKMLSIALAKYPDRKCKVYLLHGDLTDAEMHSLYVHPQIKAMVSLTHGEGYGLPLFEAAYSGLPVIAPGWSGQCDFLYAPFQGSKKKKGGNKKHPYFAEVDYNIAPVPASAVWKGVIGENSHWCYPEEGSFKMKLRQMRKQYSKWQKKAVVLQSWILKNFEEQAIMRRFVEKAIGKQPNPVSTEELPKVSLITSVFDAEEHIDQLMEDVTRQTIFESHCEWIILNANKSGDDYEEEVIKKYIEKYPNNIIYKRLDEDPGIYDTWNAAIEMSTGEFITNVNCDDRRPAMAYEEQAKILFSTPDIDLVYNDSYITHEPNVMWEDIKSDTKRYNFDKFSKEAMLRGNLPHNNPMWKKTLHDRFGAFEGKYGFAGDWEFWLRCAFGGAKFEKANQILGVYYFNPVGISTNKETESSKKKEEFEIFKKYQKLFLELKQEE